MIKINGDVNLITLVIGNLHNNTYILFKDGREDCIIIDPSSNYAMINTNLQENNLKDITILLTHGHFDHTGAAKRLQDNYNAKVYIHNNDAEKLNSALKSYSIYGKDRYQSLKEDYILHGEESLKIADIDIKVLSTPGHSAGSVCYISGNVIFTGDTLFRESYGRYDFYDGSFKDVYNSVVNKLFRLEGDYMIFPGHGEPTTLDFERKYNTITEDFNG
jgi:glyoxylase-like metal-dependent hydrolase (beta-lactamase superfamily II)